MVSMSQIGRQGSSKAIAVVENQTDPVATKTYGLDKSFKYDGAEDPESP